jgi:hypothetical protein
MRLRAALAATGAFAGLMLAASGCGDQSGNPIGVGNVDPIGSAMLWIDVEPAVPGDSSSLVAFATVLDASASDGFQLYGNPGGQGYRAVTDYAATPLNSFATGYDVYVMQPEPYDPTLYTEYVARGSRGGDHSPTGVVSEKAVSPASLGFTAGLARKTEIQLLRPIGIAEADTAPRLSWTPVPGATRYVVQISNGLGIQYMAVVPDTGHRVLNQPAVIVQDIPLRANFFFTWTVFALNADNRVIGFTPTPEGFITRRF